MKNPKEIKIRIDELESEARALELQEFYTYAKTPKKAAEELRWVLQ